MVAPWIPSDKIKQLARGTGLEFRLNGSARNLHAAIHRWFPGYVVAVRGERGYVFRPTDVELPTTESIGISDRQKRPRRPLEPSRTLSRLMEVIDKKEVKNQAEAARVLGISRERIRQLVNKHSLDLKRPGPHVGYPCEQCGARIIRKREQLKRHRYPMLCSACARRQQPRNRVIMTCRDCGRQKEFRPSYAKHLITGLCNRCWGKRSPRRVAGTKPLPRTSVRCPVCGKERVYSVKVAKKLRSPICRQCWHNRGRGKGITYQTWLDSQKGLPQQSPSAARPGAGESESQPPKR